MAQENIRVVKLDTKPAQESLQDLRKELKETRNVMLNAEEGTEEYNKALVRAAEIQHTLKEQMEEVNASAMDFGQITGNIVKATGGMVAGLQAVKASMNLLGVENEDVIKSLQKMQNLMSITQALPSIDNGIKAFKRLGLALKAAIASANGLKTALISTGIGAAVAAVGLLIANWDKLTASMNKWKIESEETKKKLEEQRKKLEELQEALKKAKQAYDDWEKADTISRLNKKAKEEYDFLANLIDGYTLKAKALQAELDAINANNNASIDDEDRWLEVDEELARVEEKLKEVTKLRDDLLNNPLNFIETLSPDDVINDEWAEKWRKKIEDGIFGEKKEKAIKVPVEVEIEEDENDLSAADALAAKYKKVIENAKEAIITPESVYEQDLRLLNLALENKKISYEEYYAYLKQLNRKKLDDDIAYFSSVASVAQTALSDIGGMFSALADAQDAQTKEGFEEQKKFQIAASTMDMLGGIVSAWVSAMNPANAWMTIWGQIAMGAASSAAILTTGLLNIDKIRKQTFGGGSTGGATNAASIGTLIAPVQYTQDVQGASIEGAIKDTKVYVTETDISNTQNKVKVTENEAFY